MAWFDLGYMGLYSFVLIPLSPVSDGIRETIIVFM